MVRPADVVTNVERRFTSELHETAQRRGARHRPRRVVRDLLPDRPALAPDPAPPELVRVAEPAGRAVPDHAGRARDDRVRVDPDAARQALDRLPPRSGRGRRSATSPTRSSGCPSCRSSPAALFLLFSGVANVARWYP